tara:strand:+ start:1085 stop:1381 length:297 start_codon:yes stop_codon:yes gene_type:complete
MELSEQFFYDHLDQIIDNTYQVLVQNKEIEDILHDDARVHMFLFDPYKGFKTEEHELDIYDILIEHYEDVEMYERCQKLLESKNLLNEIQRLPNENYK